MPKSPAAIPIARTAKKSLQRELKGRKYLHVRARAMPAASENGIFNINSTYFVTKVPGFALRLRVTL